MKLIIDLPDEAYEMLTEYQVLPESIDLEYFVIHSTPLEKELVAELLDLWAEIDIYEAPIYDQAYCRGLKKAMEFINNRIAELKGE